MNTTTTKGFTLSPRGSSLPSRKGFTLIELLVVVAIIGILAGIIITSLSDARAKARDARREADIKSIQNALEIYYLDHGEYPASLSGQGTYSNSPLWDQLEANMGGIKLPRDPVNENSADGQGIFQDDTALNYGYYATNSSAYCNLQFYMIAYNLESTEHETTSVLKRCNGSSAVYGDAIVVGVSPRG